VLIQYLSQSPHKFTLHIGGLPSDYIRFSASNVHTGLNLAILRTCGQY